MSNESGDKNPKRKPNEEQEEAEDQALLSQALNMEKLIEAHRDELAAKGASVDDMLNQIRGARGGFAKACENEMAAKESARAAQARCDAELEKIRAMLTGSMAAWESRMAAASGDDQAQERVELWEAFQDWKEQMREKLEESPHAEINALVARLEDGA